MPSKRRRTRKRDRLSALPDSVLCGILSFLPSKDAVTTSVLSKRWKPLWLSLSTLNFDDQPFHSFYHFRNFVFSVINSCDLPLQSFRLKCGNSLGRLHDVDGDLNRFVFAAAQRGVENLNLEVVKKINFPFVKLPPSINNCKTLVVLKLKNISGNDISDVNLPSLKTLYLESVSFRCHAYLMELLSGCPILEDLQTKNIFVFGKHRSKGKVQSFPNLIRADISNMYIPFTLLHNAEFLRAELKSIYYSHFPMFLYLIHLELIFDEPNKWSWDWLMGVLHHCPKVQNLTIDKRLRYRDRDVIWDDDWEDPQSVPECLSLHLGTCFLGGYKGTECELQFAKYIMQNSKVLQTMKIDSVFSIIDEKLEMLLKLSLFPRGSETCKLLFD